MELPQSRSSCDMFGSASEEASRISSRGLICEYVRGTEFRHSVCCVAGLVVRVSGA
jgi:hypothetical protein